MAQRKSPEANTLAIRGTPERELLAKFRGVNGGFQVSSRSSYRQHEQWRNDVFRGLKLLEAEGLLVVQQLIPCKLHGKCGGQPVAAGCELTPEGQRARGFRVKGLSSTRDFLKCIERSDGSAVTAGSTW